MGTIEIISFFQHEENSVAVDTVHTLFVVISWELKMFWINRKYFSTATEFFFMLKVVRKEVITCEYEGTIATISFRTKESLDSNQASLNHAHTFGLFWGKSAPDLPQNMYLTKSGRLWNMPEFPKLMIALIPPHPNVLRDVGWGEGEEIVIIGRP